MVNTPPPDWDPSRAFELKISDEYGLRVALLHASAGAMTRLEATRWVKLMNLAGVRPCHAVPIIGALRASGLPPEALRVTDVQLMRSRAMGEADQPGAHRCQFSSVRSPLDVADVLACLLDKAGAAMRRAWPKLVAALAARRLYSATVLAMLGVTTVVLLGAAKCQPSPGPHKPAPAPAATGAVEQPQGDPHPQADPNPSTNETRPVYFTVSFDGARKMTVVITIDHHKTTYTVGPEGATTAKTWPAVARVGSIVSMLAYSTSLKDNVGAVTVWVKTEGESLICHGPIVDQGQSWCNGEVPPRNVR